MTTESIKFTNTAPGLTVRDLNTSQDFYETFLGFEHVYSNEAYIVYKRDEVTIHLTTNNSAKAAGLGFCTILVSGVDDLYATALNGGVTITRAIEDSSYGLRDFLVSDPDGNTLLLGEPLQAGAYSRKFAGRGQK